MRLPRVERDQDLPGVPEGPRRGVKQTEKMIEAFRRPKASAGKTVGEGATLGPIFTWF